MNELITFHASVMVELQHHHHLALPCESNLSDTRT